MSTERLSALDASFLAVDSPSAPMHVGWVSIFDPPADGPRPGFEELFSHLAGRLGQARRYRQKLADVPFGLHEPEWVDDPDFLFERHVLHAPGADLSARVDEILSSPLERDRPLWRMWIADELADGQIALIGKAHHCMVDGAAVVELGKLLLDADPSSDGRRRCTRPGPATGRPRRRATGGRRRRRPRRPRGSRAPCPIARATAPRWRSRRHGWPLPRRGSPRCRAPRPARSRTPCSLPPRARRSTSRAPRAAITSG